MCNERLTGALLDRLPHQVHILEVNGASYRPKTPRLGSNAADSLLRKGQRPGALSPSLRSGFRTAGALPLFIPLDPTFLHALIYPWVPHFSTGFYKSWTRQQGRMES